MYLASHSILLNHCSLRSSCEKNDPGRMRKFPQPSGSTCPTACSKNIGDISVRQAPGARWNVLCSLSWLSHCHKLGRAFPSFPVLALKKKKNKIFVWFPIRPTKELRRTFGDVSIPRNVGHVVPMFTGHHLNEHEI